MKKSSLHLFVLLFISVFVFFFYLFFINLSTDTIILFISQKIFLGHWLAKGILPLFNPHIFAGVPYLFDPGVGHLHPFNLFFLLPYPYSFALWAGVTTLLFLIGFYFLFQSFTKSSLFAMLLTLVLFFSGSGFWRTNNPTIYLVIAHYGLFFYSFKMLQKKRISWPLLIIGFFMTLSGHIQFVFYGYIIGFFVGWLFYKIPLRKLFLHFLLLGLSTSWFYILSLPLVLESTRLTTHKDYTSLGPLHPLQAIQLIFPLFFGYVQNGSKWNAGPIFVILISILFSPSLLFLLIKKKIELKLGLIFLIFLAATYGIINFPFFRGAAQSFIVIHILGLILIAQNEALLLSRFDRIPRRYIMGGGIICILALLFFLSPLFSVFFFSLYKIIKKSSSLFYDVETVKTIGTVIGLNFIPLFFGFFCLFFITIKKNAVMVTILLFIIMEGLFVNYFHNYFIPQSVLVENLSQRQFESSPDYRVQTGAEVTPYFGFHNYMSEVLFRPPFSKEPTSFTKEEQTSWAFLKTLFSYNPSTWGMVHGINAIQGYNTFVPKAIAEYFKAPSADYEEEYVYIIKRNSLYGKSEIGLDINGVETSRITFSDPRWGELGVKYFISDRPLKKHTLIAQKDNKYFYENTDAIPVKHFTGIDGKIEVAKTYYENPNEMLFQIKKEDMGKKLVIIINPNGFVVEQNGKNIKVEKQNLKLIIPINETGTLKVYYSPLFHLMETLR